MARETRNPRVQVALSDRASAAVSRLAELTGDSRSKIIGEVIEEALPMFEHLIAAAEAYAVAEAKKQAEMLSALEAAEGRIVPDAERLQRLTLEAFRKAAEG